jgi:PIN domain nuclease of toxin-antitoxin system
MRNNPRLSPNAQAAISNLGNEGYVSVVSVWEAATKYRSGKLPEAAPLVQDPGRVLRLLRFTALPLQLEHARLAGSLVSPHKDPFDRMLAAQALLEGLTLVSNDAVFDSMLVTRLW